MFFVLVFNKWQILTDHSSTYPRRGLFPGRTGVRGAAAPHLYFRSRAAASSLRPSYMSGKHATAAEISWHVRSTSGHETSVS